MFIGWTFTPDLYDGGKMRITSNDPRTRYTDKLIKDSLVSLLADKKPGEVTVAELCRVANINRGTFYNHYCDIADAFADIEDDIFRKVIDRMDDINAYDLDYRFFLDMLHIVKDNATIVAIIMDDLASDSLIGRITGYAKRKYANDLRLRRYAGNDVTETDDLFAYVFNGSIGIIGKWAQGGYVRSPEDVAKRIDFFNKSVISAVLKCGGT